MENLSKIEQSNKDFLENHDIHCDKMDDGGWELESYTDGGGDQIVYVDNLTREELVECLESYDVNEGTNLWFPDGIPGNGVPFDNYKDLWDDLENWRKRMLNVAKRMPDGEDVDKAEPLEDMGDKQKASRLLGFMEAEWGGKVIINALNPYLKDSDLAELYDKMVADGIIR